MIPAPTVHPFPHTADKMAQVMAHPPPAVASGPQAAVFSYFRFNPAVHQHEKPFEILINLPLAEKNPSKFRRTNEEFEDCRAVVEDVRGRADDFSLDGNGVCWRRWEGPRDWHGIDANGVKKKGNEWIRSNYIREVEQFIKDELERQDGKLVDIVKVFDYKLRSSTDIKDFKSRTLNLDDGLDSVIPATYPHIDQSFNGAINRLREHMGEDADRLMHRRFRIINVWKPLKTVTNWPLAVCDAVTVQQQDLIATDLVRRKYVGETFYSMFNPNHQWYYLSNQKPDEVTMLKIHDSREDVVARYCLHSSFHLDSISDGGRESFEVRALVFDAED